MDEQAFMDRRDERRIHDQIHRRLAFVDGESRPDPNGPLTAGALT